MPEAGLNAVVPSLAVPFESSRNEDETKTILTHRASFNNIEHLLRSVRTAMENGNEHPWKDQMKGSSSFDNDDMSPIKTQIMRFEKENLSPGDRLLTPEATNTPFRFTLTQPLEPVLPDNAETQSLMNGGNLVFEQVQNMATNINAQTEVTRNQLKKMGKEVELIGGIDKALSAVRMTLGSRSGDSMRGTVFEMTDTLFKNVESLTNSVRSAKKDIVAVKADLIDRLPEKNTLEDFRNLSQKQLVDGPGLKVTFDSFWIRIKDAFSGEINSIKCRLTQVETSSPHFSTPAFDAATPDLHLGVRVQQLEDWKDQIVSESVDSPRGSVEVSDYIIKGHDHLREIMTDSMKPDVPVINGISCIADPCTLMHYAFNMSTIQEYRRKSGKIGFQTVSNAILHNANDFDLPKYFLEDPSAIRTDTRKLTKCPTFTDFDTSMAHSGLKNEIKKHLQQAQKMYNNSIRESLMGRGAIIARASVSDSYHFLISLLDWMSTTYNAMRVTLEEGTEEASWEFIQHAVCAIFEEFFTFKGVSGDKTTGSHIIAWAALSLRPTIKELLVANFSDHNIVINTLNKTLQLNSVQRSELKSSLKSRDEEIEKLQGEIAVMNKELKLIKSKLDKALSGKKSGG